MSSDLNSRSGARAPAGSALDMGSGSQGTRQYIAANSANSINNSGNAPKSVRGSVGNDLEAAVVAAAPADRSAVEAHLSPHRISAPHHHNLHNRLASFRMLFPGRDDGDDSDTGDSSATPAEPGDRGLSPVDRDFVAAARRGEEQSVLVEELAARVDRPPTTTRAPRQPLGTVVETEVGEVEHGERDGQGANAGAGVPQHDVNGQKHRRRRSVFEDLMRAQAPMLVIEYRKGAATVKYRHMRRAEILAEARKYSHQGAPMPSLLSSTAKTAKPAFVRSPHLLPRNPTEVYIGAGKSLVDSINNTSVLHMAPIPTGTDRALSAADVRMPAAQPFGRQISTGTAFMSPHGQMVPTAVKIEIISSMLQSRDLRLVDSNFELSKEPAVLVRRHCILINLPPVRAIIMADRCFFFPEEGMDADLIPILERLTHLGQRMGQMGGTDDQDDHDHDSNLPFEYLVLETFLITVTSMWKQRFSELHPRLNETIRKLTRHRGATAKMFDELRHNKKALGEFIGGIKAIHRVLEELLGTPEDLRSMALTHLLELEQGAGSAGSSASPRAEPQPLLTALPPPLDLDQVVAAVTAGSSDTSSESAHSQPHVPVAVIDGIALDEYEDIAEVLIESYLAEVEALVTKAKLVRDELEGSENNMNLVLANNRNRLLKTEIGITTITMCMTACSVVAGYFGMNILNRQEDSYTTFLIVTIGSSAGAIFIALVLALYLRNLLR